MDSEDFPPGTVKLASLLSGNDKKNATIVLQPRPTDNPNDPLNWPKYQKTINYFLASFYAMMVQAFINATSPTWGPLAAQLDLSSTTLTNTYAIGCGTLAIGAPMLIPFALKFGSRPVYVLSSAGQFAISIWAANTQNAGDWWGVNATQCWLGALSEVLIQMTIAEMYFVHQRGLFNAIYIWSANVGSNLAIVAAGFITQDQGWRWVWWWCAIFFGVQLIMFAFGFEETKFVHHETLEGRQGSVTSNRRGSLTATDISGHIHGDYKSEKAIPEVEKEAVPESPSAEPDEQLSDQEVARKLSTIYINPEIPRKPYLKRLTLTTTSPGPWLDFLRHSWQPFLILGSIPGVLYCSLVYAVLLAWQTVQTAALSENMLLPPYNFTAAEIGLMFLAPFIGTTLGTALCGPISDWLVLRLAKRNNGIYEPEFRFWAFLPFIPFQLAGAWYFAYALADGWAWPHVALGYGISNFGSGPLQSIALVYLLDSYNEIVGDSLTALTSVRNTFSTIFVFALPPWVAAVGLANVFNIIGAIGAVVLLFSIFFIWKGKLLRFKTAKTYRYYADRQFEARPM